MDDGTKYKFTCTTVLGIHRYLYHSVGEVGFSDLHQI